MIANGLVLGWPVQFLPKLQSKDTPLASGPIDREEISWIVGISCAGSLLSLICNGFIISIIGSKRILLCCTIPIIIFWLLIRFATDFYWILSARVISGCTSSIIYLGLILYSGIISLILFPLNTNFVQLLFYTTHFYYSGRSK